MIHKTPPEDAMTVIPACPVFNDCGGCKYNALSYEKQLIEKQKQLEKLLGAFCAVSPIRGMDDPLHYRHKVHQVLARGEGGSISGGYYAAGSHRVVTVPSCRLDDEACQAVIRTVCRLAKEFGLPVYNEYKKTGLLRHIMVRKSRATGQMMVILVAASPQLHGKTKFVQQLTAAHPKVTSVILNVNDRRTSMVLGEKNITLFGPGYLTDTLCGLRFKLSPSSFFQVNPVMTEPLYETAMDFAGLSGTETVIDAYCGTGTIGLIAAERAREVIGAELNASAVRDARENARANNIRNARFVHADAGRFMTELAARGEHADVVFLDPPRSGCTPEFVNALLRLAPNRVIYISCGPESLARDLTALTKGDYTVSAIQPWDLFPMTAPVETVVLLVRKNPDTYINVKLDLDELDLTSAEAKATYDEIKDYILKEHGVKVSTLYIAQTKRKCGLEVGEHYNKSNKDEAKQAQCPEDKEKLIIEALRHFKMISA